MLAWDLGMWMYGTKQPVDQLWRSRTVNSRMELGQPVKGRFICFVCPATTNCARYTSRVWTGSSNTVDIPSIPIPLLWQTFYCSRIGNVFSSETWQFLNGPNFGRCIINDQLINGGLVYWVHPVVKKYGNRKSVCKKKMNRCFSILPGVIIIICGPLVGCVNTAWGGCFGTRCWRLLKKGGGIWN